MSRQLVDVEMLELFKAELALCKVKKGEVVAVLSGGEDQLEYAQTFMLAAQSLGATTFHLNVPKYGQSKVAGLQGRHALTGNQPAIDTLKRVDMVIDLLGLLFSREQAEIQEAGTRILRVMEPFHILKKMFPTEDLRRRTELSRTLLQSASKMRITSPGGTDVTYGLKQYPVISEYGYTDEPGRWDHFPIWLCFHAGHGWRRQRHGRSDARRHPLRFQALHPIAGHADCEGWLYRRPQGRGHRRAPHQKLYRQLRRSARVGDLAYRLGIKRACRPGTTSRPPSNSRRSTS